MMVRKISEKLSKVVVNVVLGLGCFLASSSVSREGIRILQSDTGWHLSSPGFHLVSAGCSAQKGLVVGSASTALNTG